MNIGYVRVSTVEQNLDMQMDALHNDGCKEIFQDKVSGTQADREGLEKALEYMREGDTLVVWKLDRLGRSLKHLIELITQLNKKKMYFKSLQEKIDTSTSGGKLIFHVFGALAEFERDMISERTRAGLKAAKKRGRMGGRPKKLSAKEIALAKSLMEDESNSIGDICELLGVSRSTIYRNVNDDSK